MKTITLIVLSAFVSLFLAEAATAQAGEEVEARIEQAAGVLLGSQASGEEIKAALLQLMDISVEIFPPSKYSDEIHSEMEVAKTQFKNTSLMNPKGRQYLLLTYRMMTGGKKYQAPEELDDFISPSEAREKGQRYARKLLDAALAEHRSGDKAKCAVALLELVIMTVTPVGG